MRRIAPGITGVIILLLMLAGILAAGCANNAPGAIATPPPAVANLPTATPFPVATDLPAATNLPTASPLPNNTYSPAAAELLTPTASPTAAPTPAPGLVGLLRLTAALDDPQHYCIDVPGHSNGVQLDAPLQAHTCKPGADDQLFELGRSDEYSTLRMPAYAQDGGPCLAVMGDAPSPAILVPCHGRDETLFSVAQLRNGGRLSVKAASFRERCIGIATGAGEPAGGRNHLRRNLTLYDCAAADPALITWELVEQ